MDKALGLSLQWHGDFVDQKKGIMNEKGHRPP